MSQEIIIKPSFDSKSTIKAVFYIIYKPQYLFIIAIAFFMLILKTLNYLGFGYDFKTEKYFDIMPFWGIIALLVFPFYFFYIIYKSTKKQITNNPRLKEDIHYIINNEFIQEKGESFEIKHFWKNLYQIVEKKEMFLIFTLKNKAMIIKKEDLKNNQYNELKELFSSLKIKKELK